jgi:hypothetical protein
VPQVRGVSFLLPLLLIPLRVAVARLRGFADPLISVRRRRLFRRLFWLLLPLSFAARKVVALLPLLLPQPLRRLPLLWPLLVLLFL